MKLTGYFNTLDKVKYGVDKKRRPYYGFIPFQSDYKKIKITYSGKQKGKLLAQIELLNEDSFPLGRIINIIGRYSYENIEKLLLIECDNKIKADIIEERGQELLEDYEKEFITIDPEGSTDLDDGFYFEYPYLDIIIASPIYFLSNRSVMEKYKKAVSSLYYYKTEHLWGEDINEKCSLLKNNKTVLLVQRYNLENKNVEIKFCVGKNFHQLSYKFVNKLIKRREDKNLEKELVKYSFLLEWIEELRKYFIFKNSKELVQEIMVLSNKLFTEYFEKNKIRMFYREFDFDENFEKIVLPKKVKKIFNQRNGESARYTLYKKEHKLMKGLYSHFTSPLRRWIDCYHQLELLNFMERGIGITEELCKIDEEELNNKFLKVNKFHREYNYYIENKSFEEKKYNGYIYYLKNNKFDVWCPEINRFVKVEIINSRLLFQLDITYDVEENTWRINNNITKEEMFYKLGQEIEFNIKLMDNLIPSKQILGFLK